MSVSRNYVIEKLKDIGRILPEHHVDRILSIVGNDKQKLVKEINKIDLFLGDSSDLSINDIDKLLITDKDRKFNDLVCLIGSRSLDEILLEINNITDPAFTLQFMSYFSNWLEKAFIFLVNKEKGVHTEVIKKMLKLQPYEINKIERSVSGFTSARVLKIINSLADFDLLLKSSFIDSNVALVNFMVYITKGS